LCYKPPQGYFSCTIDAAIFEPQEKYGAGLCIKDEGGLVAAKTCWADGIPLQRKLK